ncbi:MAG TPA: response regulator [Ferruginibacter sp.]|nr:response regulator [Ferruginibacter sp.]
MHQASILSKQLHKVLIVEDEGDICLLLNIILDGDNVDLEHVNTIAAAKQYLEEKEPALIMLDNKLPDGLGMDFIKYLKSNYPSIKILMISGFQAAVTKDIALENGADLYLEKPFTKEQIYQSVQTLLS